MATTDVTNTLIANISSTEQSSSAVDINRSTNNPAFPCNVGQFTTYFSLAAGVNNIPLPFNPCTQLYIRNIDPSKSVVVTWTNNNGGSSAIITLNIGDQIICWCSPAGAINPGITALSMTPSAAGCLVEYFLGG
jgi:hypothetical protein